MVVDRVTEVCPFRVILNDLFTRDDPRVPSDKPTYIVRSTEYRWNHETETLIGPLRKHGDSISTKIFHSRTEERYIKIPSLTVPGVVEVSRVLKSRLTFGLHISEELNHSTSYHIHHTHHTQKLTHVYYTCTY